VNTITPLHTYTFVDKSDWGQGAWHNEPDKVQWIDAATGLDCLAVRSNPALGNWCGYVGVPEGHPAFGLDHDDVDADAHGGLTFSGLCRDGEETTSVCHIPAEGRPDRVWWLGFDCGHCYDVQPAMDARIPGIYPMVSGSVYRTLGYVQAECADLARQLAEQSKSA
jgi:hypothetical protein